MAVVIAIFLWCSGLFVLALLALGALYYLAPGVVLRAATATARRSAGLRLREVSVDGHRIPYLEGGRGEPLLLLHGFGANKDHWTMIAPRLTRDFRVIVPDLPGFGDSTRDWNARYGVDEQVARIAAFAAALGLDSFHLGGNSMGGYLATLFAARHPQAVKSLWLLAPAGASTAAPSETQMLIEQGDNPLLITGSEAFDRLSELCFCVVPYMPAQFKRPLIERALRDHAFNNKIFTELFSAPVWLDTGLGTLENHTLLVWGDTDRILHPSGLEVLKPLFRHGEFVMMPRMGHVPMIERPAETAADFLQFQHRAQSPS